MEKLIDFSGLEAILRTAIKISSLSIKDIANIADISKSGLYCFTSGQNHISVEKGDRIINYLKENDYKSLKIATEIYLNQ